MHRRALLITGLLLLPICLFGVLTTVSAQTITGRISGTVTDPSGAALPGVSVKITNAATDLVRTVTTDGNGFYVATSLPVGTYSVSIEHQGFKKISKSGYDLIG